jgi:hypothetical protein
VCAGAGRRIMLPMVVMGDAIACPGSNSVLAYANVKLPKVICALGKHSLWGPTAVLPCASCWVDDCRTPPTPWSCTGAQL